MLQLAKYREGANFASPLVVKRIKKTLSFRGLRRLIPWPVVLPLDPAGGSPPVPVMDPKL